MQERSHRIEMMMTVNDVRAWQCVEIVGDSDARVAEFTCDVAESRAVSKDLVPAG